MGFEIRALTDDEVLKMGREVTEDERLKADRTLNEDEKPVIFFPYNFDTIQMFEGTYYDLPYEIPDEDEDDGMYLEMERRYITRDTIGKRTSKELWLNCSVGLGKCEERKDKIGFFVKTTNHVDNIEKLQKMYDLGVGMCHSYSERECLDRLKLTKKLYNAGVWIEPTLYLFEWEDLGSLKVYEELLRWYGEERIVCLAEGDPYEILGRLEFNNVKKIREIKRRKHKELVESNRQARHQRRLWKAQTRKLKRQQRLMERVRNGDVVREDIIESTTTKEYRPDESTTTDTWLTKRKEKYSSLKEDKKVYDVVVDYYQGRVESIYRGIVTLWNSLPSCEK